MLSRIKDEALDCDDLMGQYLRDMWYMETLCPDDIREFMIIPINSSTRLSEFARTLKSCSNTVSCSDLLNIVKSTSVASLFIVSSIVFLNILVIARSRFYTV